MGKVIIIDDDANMIMLKETLEMKGHAVFHYKIMKEAIKNFNNIVDASIVILDLRIPYKNYTVNGGSKKDSMQFLVDLHRQKDQLPILVYSAIQEAHIIDALREMDKVYFQSKWETLSMQNLVERIRNIMGEKKINSLLNVFIVHGHDDVAKLELKNYLQNTLKLKEPVILHEQQSHGLTIIEKLEVYSVKANLVFILLTPDDISAQADDQNEQKYKARQNVIFEMGYFLGILGRKSGRVILLYKGKLELPSDLSGIIYIDISNGIESVGENIRREVENARD